MIRRVAPGSVFRDKLAFSRAIDTGAVVHVSATGPTDIHGTLVATGAYDQTVEVFRQISEALCTLGLDLGDISRLRIYLRDFAQLDEILRAQHPLFDAAPPACSVICVAAFHVAGMHVYIEADAIRP